MAALTGVEARRIDVDKGYRGRNHPHRLRVWSSGQVRRVTASIRREMKRRAAVEPVIGHVKSEHRMDRNYLKGHLGDSINAVLAAAGYNFALLLAMAGRTRTCHHPGLRRNYPGSKDRLNQRPSAFFTAHSVDPHSDRGGLRARPSGARSSTHGRAQAALSVGEDAHHIGLPPDLLVKALQHVGRLCVLTLHQRQPEVSQGLLDVHLDLTDELGVLAAPFAKLGRQIAPHSRSAAVIHPLEQAVVINLGCTWSSALRKRCT
ncbi:hypothetical protein ABIB82_007821 [Bradyrhizobium sp. i1.8.4]